MIGPRAERQSYRGHWYKYSTNGWGILDFMDFCEAAEFEYVPTFGMHETPKDMADFVRYATAAIDTEWGKKRSRDGHPQPYQLKYLQLGNEERVDEAYADTFARLADAIWAIDKNIQLIVGDFVYEELITDPSRIRRSASGITNLEGQRKVLQFAKERNQEVWFDVHVWTGGPRPNQSFDAFFTYIDALESLADGAKFKVLTFEFNANNHDQRRAIANALAINAIERDGRVPIATSANCLQPVGQNDNGWDQGLVFLSPSQVWMQPPGYVTQMYSDNYGPMLVECSVAQDEQAEQDLDCNAKLSGDGASLVLNIVNVSAKPKSAVLQIAGFILSSDEADVIELSGELDAANTETNPTTVSPQCRNWEHGLAKGSTSFTFKPNSVTTIVLK
ncbi:Extracellular exo-alpha-L-arabinofuranosidase precursor [Planctomycetes bacterium CA13]|uniref:non-reducing end alpha-L-arabinofuranosidase n=1 Tax=Novipirellula herctigrandis TaxID=2527986 RepID=A0A5C5Z020_9BACT|nr:Extracellular exo-alpha-L-arabinofuranosidase precursor [Planctomycetes bacterium CA13]